MSDHLQLTALADRTRRTIFEMLAVEPRSVGSLSETLPVSRPAVSQHLKVLERAGLVSSRRDGTRHIYSVIPTGLIQLREWVDTLWDQALDRFEAAAHKEHTTMTHPIPVVTKTRIVPIPVESAFRLFTEGLDTWWPLDGFSIGAEVGGGRPAASVRFEGRVGGRVVEVSPEGTEYVWADVIAWQPPHRFVVAWHPTLTPTAASMLEVRFSPVDAGTRLDLEHRGWEEFGDAAHEVRGQYDPGWDTVLAPFEEAARRSGA
jgi:DNA-binding transcriptional ArsR family regulator